MSKWEMKCYCPKCGRINEWFLDKTIGPDCCPRCGELAPECFARRGWGYWPNAPHRRVRTGWFSWKWERKEENKESAR